MGVAGAPTSDIRCAAMLELTGNQDRGTVHQLPPAGDSPSGDPNTACTERASGGTHLTPMGEGRDRVCGAIYSLIEENYALQKGQEASTSGRRGEPRRFLDLARPRYVTARPALGRVTSCCSSSTCITPRWSSFEARYDPLIEWRLMATVPLPAFSRADSCDKGAGSSDILPALANNTRKAERMQDASRCRTRYEKFWQKMHLVSRRSGSVD